MASTHIDTTLPTQPDPTSHSRRIFVRLLLLGAITMGLIWYTDNRRGLSTPFDDLMLPVLTCVTLLAAGIVAVSRRHMRKALAVNGVVLVLYYEGLIAQAVMSSDPVTTYSLASIAQYLPGLYIALFVFLSRHAAHVCWLLYASIAAQCLYGMLYVPAGPTTALKEQLYWCILTAHPCCILVLSFMNHLRKMVDEAQGQSLAAKERFLAVVSHEVRSPLQTIVSSLELVEKMPPEPLLGRSIARVKGAAGMLEAQIRDLTSFTRLELSPDLHPEPVELTALAAAIEQTHQEAAQRKGLELVLQVPNMPLTVMADAARLRQIMDNLVGNALKYTTQGRIVIGLEQEGSGSVHWWVSDTGRGIPANRLQQVFEPFVRIKAAPQEKIEGSGLGLAVVRQLAGLMKGHIHVDSEEGAGTRVDIRLPLPDAAPRTRPETARPPRKVMVIDDDVGILHAISDLLKQWGVAEIITATDGEEARRLLREHAVDVALVDLQLPSLSGYQVALAATQPDGVNARTPMIAMSAVALNRRTPGASAFASFMPKPIERTALIQAVGKAMTHTALRQRADDAATDRTGPDSP